MINIIWLRGEKNSRWNDTEDRNNFRMFAHLVSNKDGIPYELCQWLLMKREGPGTDTLVRLVPDDWRSWDDVWLTWLKYAIAHNETFALETGTLVEELEQLKWAEEAAIARVETLVFSDPFLSQLIDEL